MKDVIKKWWFWLIVGLVAIYAIGAASGQLSDSSKSSSRPASLTASQSTSRTEKTSHTSVSSTPKESESKPAAYGVGDTAQKKSYKLMVDSFREVKSDNQCAQPDEGKMFVEVVMTVENTTVDSELNISLLDFYAYEDGYVLSDDFSALTASDIETIGGTVAGGKKLQGGLCYQVSEDFEELEIDVKIGYGSGNKTKLLLNRATLT